LLSNAAIAAQSCLDQGGKRVTVLDVDFHHGNGSQSIFYARNDVQFVSLHGDPRRSYPYFSGHRDETGRDAGLGFNHNYPLPHGTDWPAYAEALAHACQQIRLSARTRWWCRWAWIPSWTTPSAISRLHSDDYFPLGAAIAALGIPTLFVMEGGYMVDEIGINAVNVLLEFRRAGAERAGRVAGGVSLGK
jgi:acetoin utilization deacetylase AcuC-like enzyme